MTAPQRPASNSDAREWLAERGRVGCVGCGVLLRVVIGRNFYTCDTDDCGGNISHLDGPGIQVGDS